VRTVVVLVAAVLTSAYGADDVRVGDVVQGELRLGSADVRRVMPLPAGQWQVVRVNNIDGRRTRPDQQLDPPKFVDVALAQREGSNLVMLMRVITLREPTAITRWALEREPCAPGDALHRDAYDSTSWDTKCLLVNHVAGFLTTASSGYSDVRQWVAGQNVRIPSTALHSVFTRFAPHQNLTVHVWANPALRELDSTERSRAANPFHPDWLANEPQRKHYVDEFIAWSEAYMKRVLADGDASEKGAVAAFR
jgi:hypothetical protein